MAADFEARTQGLPELRAALQGIVPKLRRQALRNALAAGARIVRDAARAATPVISPGHPQVKAGHRAVGTVRKAISVRTSKRDRAAGDVGVFVNVRPAKGAAYRGGVQVRASSRGARNPRDPYYWRWLEFGRKARPSRQMLLRRRLGQFGRSARRIVRGVPAMRAFGFLRRGATALPRALQTFIAKIGPAIARLADKNAPL